MNVITGVFVDSAITKTKEQSAFFMINNVRELIRCGGSMSREMSWEDFEGMLSQPEMTRYFEFLDVALSDAHALFRLIDADQSGTISSEEFFDSCMRLKGPAKSLDLQLLMHEVNGLGLQMRKHLRYVELQLGIVEQQVGVTK